MLKKSEGKMSKEGIRINIPNLISLLRLLCVPLTVWLIINSQVLAAFGYLFLQV